MEDSFNVYDWKQNPNPESEKDNVIAIQLPRLEKAHDALEIINDALIPKNQ